ncbi:MAG: protease pro-enzyme activation domain-containing protein [Candidatus Tumulicola sp.]
MLRAPLVGTLPPRRILHLAIGLPVRNAGDFRSAVDAISKGGNAPRRSYITPAEFASRFAPSESNYRSVLRYARDVGLTVERTYSGRVVVDVTGSVEAIQRAFHITLQTRRRPDGSLFYAPNEEPAVAIRTPILYVEGLDNEIVPPLQ